MNKIGVYYAFLTNSDTVDWHDCLARAARAGAEILEMSAPKLHALPAGERADIARHARDLGLSLTMATGLSPAGDISSDDARVHRAGVDSLLRDIDLAAAMGVEAMGGIVTGVSKHFPEGIEHTRERALENSARGLARVGAAAGAAGVAVCVEVVNRFESPLLNTAEQALRFVRAVGQPMVGIHLDTFHMNIEERDIAAAIRLAGDRLIHFHVCENNRALPGQGHIDWPAVFGALKAIGYAGRIVIESLPGPYGTVAGRLNIWRRLCENVDEELAASIGFLKGHLARAQGA